MSDELDWFKRDGSPLGYEFRLVRGADGRRRWFVDGQAVSAAKVETAIGRKLCARCGRSTCTFLPGDLVCRLRPVSQRDLDEARELAAD